MRRDIASVVRIALVGGVLGLMVSCGPKETGGTTPVDEGPTPVEVPQGPVRKLMPPEVQPKVEAVFKIHLGDLERCYNDYVVATGNEKLRGTIILAVTIGLTLNPSKVWFLRNDFKDLPKLTECFLEKVKLWEFPTWGGLMDYSFRRVTLEEL